MTATPSRILVVEDSATQAAALTELLERAGYATYVARRAERALELLADHEVELVLSDVVMPGMDGYELTRRIRAVPQWSTLPIVLLTSLTDPLAIVRGLEAGAHHYVTKPYEPEALLARVHAVLERRDVAHVLVPKPFTVELLGAPFTITATKEQILELLVASYSDLVRTSEAVRLAEGRARFLGEASELLTSSLDVQDVLRELARLAVPVIADVCTATLVEDGDVPASDVVQRAVASAAPAFVAVADGSALSCVVADEQERAAVMARGDHALLVVPLVARDRVLGVLQFLAHDEARLTSPDDRRLIDDLARRAALSVDNALLYGHAQRATRARDDVLAIVSHDLRSPLATIEMSTSFMLDMLEEDPDAKLPLASQLQLIKRATTRGNALIQDLLDVARIESGTLAMETSLASAATLLRHAGEELAPLAAAKGVRFECTWTGIDAEVPADGGRVAQLFANLVGNAVKFTARDGLVRLAGRRLDAVVEFEVSDSGAGIAADDVPRLFDRFWKANKASRGGAGLGLFIVKGIVEGHGGTMHVESALGTGTVFRFTLPGSSSVPWRPGDAVA